MQLFGSFYGFESRANLNRLFKIYATNEGLFGGWLAPCDTEGLLARCAGQQPTNQKMAALLQSAGDWEQHLDSLLPGGDELLAAHAHNFAFEPSFTQASLTWKLKMLERAPSRFGALDVCLDGAKRRRFYLVGRRTPDEVAGMLEAALPQLSVEGRPVVAKRFASLEGASQS